MGPSAQVLHRDLKTQNLFFDEGGKSGDVRLGDLGTWPSIMGAGTTPGRPLPGIAPRPEAAERLFDEGGGRAPGRLWHLAPPLELSLRREHVCGNTPVPRS